MANIRWMINNVGWRADEVGVGSGGQAIASGYNIKDMISGPRNKLVRAGAGTAVVHYPYYGVTNYNTTPTKMLEASHVVVSRFDKLITHQYYSTEQRVTVISFNGAGAATTHINYDPLSSTVQADDLLGPRAQDFVLAFNSGNVAVATRLALQVRHATSTSTSWAAEIGQVYFCKPWDPGMGPVLNPQPQWTRLESDARFTPARSARDYEIEAEIQLTWRSITDAKRDELATYYGGDDCLLNWPFFLYDEDSTLWNHKLEHVILADYQWTKRGDGYNDLTCIFYRLRHYP